MEKQNLNDKILLLHSDCCAELLQGCSAVVCLQLSVAGMVQRAKCGSITAACLMRIGLLSEA